MAGVPVLRQAWLLYRQGRFASALEFLEAKVFQHRENPEFFRCLGLCCLQTGDWNGGETYLQRSRQLETPVHRDTLLGLMAVAARRSEFGTAAQIAVELLDRNPRDRVVKAALAKLRTSLSEGEGEAPDRETLAGWLPRSHKMLLHVQKWLLRVGIGLLICAGLVVGTWWGLSVVHPATSVPAQRKGPEALSLPASAADTVLPSGGFALTLSADEIRKGWERAQQAFQAYQDSRARFEINRLLLSNASPLVKERARSLISFLHEPDFSRVDDSSPYQDVKKAPTLYEGCTVRWSGVITNLVSGTTLITFDLLLGYQQGQVVEGIVPVQLAFAALLKNSQVVEVLGRVAVKDGSWFIQGTSLRELGYRTP